MTDEGPESSKTVMGRPTVYDPAYVAQAAKLCALGATDDEMADFFGIHRSTLYRWKLDHEDFCDSIKSAKDVADERVERSLYQKATGYDITEEQAVKLRVDQYKDGVEVVEVRKHIPADTTAAIFWMKNRRKDAWRDKHEVEHSGSIDLANVIAERRARVAGMDEE